MVCHGKCEDCHRKKIFVENELKKLFNEGISKIREEHQKGPERYSVYSLAKKELEYEKKFEKMKKIINLKGKCIGFVNIKELKKKNIELNLEDCRVIVTGIGSKDFETLITSGKLEGDKVVLAEGSKMKEPEGTPSRIELLEVKKGTLAIEDKGEILKFIGIGDGASILIKGYIDDHDESIKGTISRNQINFENLEIDHRDGIIAGNYIKFKDVKGKIDELQGSTVSVDNTNIEVRSSRSSNYVTPENGKESQIEVSVCNIIPGTGDLCGRVIVGDFGKLYDKADPEKIVDQIMDKGGKVALEDHALIRLVDKRKKKH